jgi:transcriptional regulator with XRE-family HTH domain
VVHTFPVPRRPINPDNPVTKLRAAFSEPNCPQLSRPVFAKRFGFSFATIKDLEQGKFALTKDMAQRIATVTGVDLGSLLANETPLLAWNGEPLNYKTKLPQGAIDDKDVARAVFLVRALIEAAREAKHNRSRSLLLALEEWLGDTARAFNIEEPFWTRLFGSWGEFEPDQATLRRFWPRIAAKGKADSRHGIYGHLADMRGHLIVRKKAEIFCESQPKRRASKLRAHLGTHLGFPADNDLKIFRFPEDSLERSSLALELEKGWTRFGKIHGVLKKNETRGLTSEERSRLDKDILLPEALKRLAQAQTPLVEPSSWPALSLEMQRQFHKG